jgi:hypothetical protein
MKSMEWKPLCLLEHLKANRLLSVDLNCLSIFKQGYMVLHVHSFCGIAHVYINCYSTIWYKIVRTAKGKGKVRPIAGHERPEGE